MALVLGCRLLAAPVVWLRRVQSLNPEILDWHEEKYHHTFQRLRMPVANSPLAPAGTCQFSNVKIQYLVVVLTPRRCIREGNPTLLNNDQWYSKSHVLAFHDPENSRVGRICPLTTL